MPGGSRSAIGPDGGGVAADGTGEAVGAALVSGATHSTPVVLPGRSRARPPGARLGPMEGYDAATYGDRYAEVYDAWYGDLTDTDACVDALSELAGAGAVLELGVGSGRIALPLARRGLEVHGIDASAAMLAALAAKPDGDTVTVTLGDMAEVPLEGRAEFDVVFVAFNTFFNLTSDRSQRRCLERVADVLSPEGLFVVEAFVPGGDAGAAARTAVEPRLITADEVVLAVSRADLVDQTVTGQHVHITEAGIRLRPWHLRYLTPRQLDAMAADAGLELVERRGGWRGEAFTDDSGVHVSIYRRGNVRTVIEEPPPAAQR